MKPTKTLSLFDEGLFLLNRQVAPSKTQVLGDLGVMHVRGFLADDATFDLAPYHEWVHGTFDVSGTVFFRLK